MKVHKTITLDADVCMLLEKRKINQSKLINRLIREYFGENLKECIHEWSNWFTTPAGLMRECKLCGKTEKK